MPGEPRREMKWFRRRDGRRDRWASVGRFAFADTVRRHSLFAAHPLLPGARQFEINVAQRLDSYHDFFVEDESNDDDHSDNHGDCYVCIHAGFPSDVPVQENLPTDGPEIMALLDW